MYFSPLTNFLKSMYSFFRKISLSGYEMKSTIIGIITIISCTGDINVIQLKYVREYIIYFSQINEWASEFKSLLFPLLENNRLSIHHLNIQKKFYFVIHLFLWFFVVFIFFILNVTHVLRNN